jgi:hypothetical protein
MVSLTNINTWNFNIIKGEKNGRREEERERERQRGRGWREREVRWIVESGTLWMLSLFPRPIPIMSILLQLSSVQVHVYISRRCSTVLVMHVMG